MIIEKEHLSEETMLHKVKGASLILRAVNNKLRQSILKLLEQHARLTVTEIMINIMQEQSITSQHLAILRRSKIVTTEREGKKIYYALNHLRLQQIHDVNQSLLAT